MIGWQNRPTARACFESLQQVSHPVSGRLVSFPGLEAILHAFKLVFDAIIEFQSSSEPTLDKILPSLQYIVEELERIEMDGAVVWEDGAAERPSICTMRFCIGIQLEISKIEVHRLWCVSCFLFPFLRDMNVLENPT